MNDYIVEHKFKYESLNMVRDLLQPGGYMFSWDITSGYYHVEIHEDFHKYSVSVGR